MTIMKLSTAVLLLTTFSLPAAAADRVFEKTVPVPRDRDAELEWTHEGCSIESLTLRNYPDEEDIEKSRQEDPNDKTWLWWEFNVANRSDEKCKIRFELSVLDKKGAVIKSSDRSGTVEPGERDDEIRVSMLIKTLDIVDAVKVRIRAEIKPK